MLALQTATAQYREPTCLPVLLPTEKTIEWVLPYQQYQDQLVDQAALMLTLSGRVSETQQVLANQTTFRLRTPDLIITVGSPEILDGCTYCS